MHRFVAGGCSVNESTNSRSPLALLFVVPVAKKHDHQPYRVCAFGGALPQFPVWHPRRPSLHGAQAERHAHEGLAHEGGGERQGQEGLGRGCHSLCFAFTNYISYHRVNVGIHVCVLLTLALAIVASAFGAAAFLAFAFARSCLLLRVFSDIGTQQNCNLSQQR